MCFTKYTVKELVASYGSIEEGIKRADSLFVNRLKSKKDKDILNNFIKAQATSPDMNIQITAPSKAYEAVKDLALKEVEHFVVVLLDTKKHIIGRKVISKGSINTTIVHPREVFCEAIRHRAASIFVAHNHPSGDVTPSPEDIELTTRLRKAANILAIQMFDHIVVGNNTRDGRYTSMSNRDKYWPSI